ncbi:acetate kinase [Alkalibacterium putridalgicola]|uniref:Acetate kinase n=1 Tax=Alkalibacterium putridalgicola TaxID=426703 RepID=A0A1H7SNP2_9LACT|nr:acetate kinase [Alkalibacterium putridalgicola]GEK89196.1 acetate kinase [Alkalibacterium putridalgicola]SEL74260.1 acetate kinase [Alkalibacterium putridalgicola]
MKKILSVNAGSSSLKFQLFLMPEEKVIAKGLIERIGLSESIISIDYLSDGEEKTFKQTKDIANHEEAVDLLFKLFYILSVVKDSSEIKGVGHRVASGGELFPDSVVITDDVVHQIDSLGYLAPLHNPPQAKVIKSFKDMLPDTLMVAVFDTSFHATLPSENYLYSIPYEYYEKYGVRKYGFHGTSHSFVAKRAAELLDRPIEDLKIVTCHLGNGASIAAVDGGRSVDTSMGFTPLAGLTMGTRSGDVDPSILPYLMEKLDLTEVDDMIKILNNKSGLLGLSGISSDMRDVETAAASGNVRAKLALEIFVNRVQKYIGSYIAEMNGADAIVFTAGIGENAPNIRDMIISGLSWFGMTIDTVQNDTRKEAVISTEDSRITVLNVPTNEEIEIARQVERLGARTKISN